MGYMEIQWHTFYAQHKKGPHMSGVCPDVSLRHALNADYADHVMDTLTERDFHGE